MSGRFPDFAPRNAPSRRMDSGYMCTSDNGAYSSGYCSGLAPDSLLCRGCGAADITIRGTKIRLSEQNSKYLFENFRTWVSSRLFKVVKLVQMSEKSKYLFEFFRMQPNLTEWNDVKIIKKNDNDNYLFEHRITSLRSVTHYLCSLRYVHRKLEKQLRHLFVLARNSQKT